MYQNLSFLFVTIGIICCNPIIFGISFLLVEPKDFMCQLDGVWKSCKKTTVCVVLKGNRSDYYAVEDSPTYIDNWIKKFDLLCEHKMLVGCLCVLYFTGVTCGTIIISNSKHHFGKKSIFCSFLFVSLIG